MTAKKKERPNRSVKASVPASSSLSAAVPPQAQALPERFPPPPKRPKMGRNVAVCSFYALIALLIAVSAFFFFMAKTGLVCIPFVSSFYRGPAPVRIVDAPAADPDTLLGRISSVVGSAVSGGDAGPYTVPFTEEELTSFVRGGLADVLRGQGTLAERVQIAVTPAFIEASGLITASGLTVDALARFDADVEDGELRLNVCEAYLGDVPVHPKVVRQLESALFTKDFASWNVSAGDVKLKDVILGDGELELVFE
jgi:hypothetical protein